jgi:hypothetical protein
LAQLLGQLGAFLTCVAATGFSGSPSFGDSAPGTIAASSSSSSTHDGRRARSAWHDNATMG